VDIAASQLLQHIHPDAVVVSLRQSDGGPCREISVEALRTLIACDYVIGFARGRKLRQIRLTVPPDVAFRELGETRKRVKSLFNSDANTTVQRSLPCLPKHIKKHHRQHCMAWASLRHLPMSARGSLVPVPGLLKPNEMAHSSSRPLRPPMMLKPLLAQSA
jgi:hypothetical protein